MDLNGGWTIWTTSGERIRQFSVAIGSEAAARARVRADNPDVAILSCYPVASATLVQLGMSSGDITEWVPLDCKVRVVTAGWPSSAGGPNGRNF